VELDQRHLGIRTEGSKVLSRELEDSGLPGSLQDRPLLGGQDRHSELATAGLTANYEGWLSCNDGRFLGNDRRERGGAKRAVHDSESTSHAAVHLGMPGPLYSICALETGAWS
jgi:hypothetical protein